MFFLQAVTSSEYGTEYAVYYFSQRGVNIVQTSTNRVLRGYRLSPAHWAILSTADLNRPVSHGELISQAQSHSEETLSPADVGNALHDCITAGLLVYQNGLVLSDRGNRLKNQINSELMELVELA